MRVRITMAGSERVVEAEVDAGVLDTLEAAMVSGPGGWLACEDVNTGWRYHVNLAHVARLERAAS